MTDIQDTPDTPDLDPRVNAYLDGTLTPEQTRALLAAAQSDSVLAEQLETQTRIAASLRASFSPPSDLAGRFASVASAAAPRRPDRLSFRRIAPLAAALLLVASVGWFVVKPLLAEPPVQAAALYEKIVKAGSVPQFVCTSEREFRAFTKKQFGQAIAYKPSPNVNMVGWNYRMDLFSPDTVALLADVGSTHVVVFIDRAEFNRDVALPVDPALRVFTSQIGGLMFYEVTPLDRAFVTQVLYKSLGEDYR